MGGLSSFVGNLTGGLIGESDAEAAAGVASGLSRESRDKILGELDQSWSDIEGYMDPYLSTGQEALTQYKDALGLAPDAPVFEGFSFDPSQIESNPAYQFIRDQNLQAMDRLYAKNRGLTSGNRITGTSDYISGLASTEYGNEFNRQMQSYLTNRDTGQLNFANAGTAYDRDMGYLSPLVNMGNQFTTNLASLRSNFSDKRAGAYSNYAAEQTAANMIPAQEKMGFTQGLIGAAGTIVGGKLAGGGGLTKGWT